MQPPSVRAMPKARAEVSVWMALEPFVAEILWNARLLPRISLRESGLWGLVCAALSVSWCWNSARIQAFKCLWSCFVLLQEQHLSHWQMMNALAKWQPYTPLDTDENAMGALMGCADPAAIHCTGCDFCWPKTRERQTSADDPRIFHHFSTWGFRDPQITQITQSISTCKAVVLDVLGDSKIPFDSHRFHTFRIFASLLLMHCQSCHSLEGASSDDAKWVLFGGHCWDRL